MYVRGLVLVVVSSTLFACGGTVSSQAEPAAGGAGIGGSSGKGGAPPGNGGSFPMAGAPGAGGGVIAPREPARHREAAVACPSGTAAGPSLPCTTDAECTGGPSPKCILSGGTGYCLYGFCTSDATCDAGQLCECAQDGYSHHCVSATGCAIDSDCPGSWCSPTFGTCGTYSGVIAYQCHTPQDRCVDDSDCGAGAYCMFEPSVGYWLCGSGQCVG